ncbi:cupin domain-containing protein [Xylophilus sp.]|uniref:cupin domain-containing protein n=1 Tax=Xylophilus sp. TaxID=2653893 RepID=UPI0013B8AE99|nr:hypothetical protein [Xylophilus sp.]KAF1049991.1 MAG: hypothetical protein GAK38_00015 [Xylophilus sp.]
MQQFTLRLFEDRIPPHHPPIYLPAAARAVYVVEGHLTIEFQTGSQHVAAGGAWLGDDEAAFLAGDAEAVLWRWELVPTAVTGASGALRSAPWSTSTCKLAQPIELDTASSWLMRCDRVQFPPGGVALTHVHQGPGIRCCLEGEITIETLGESHVHRPGDAWFELGYAPVLAPTTEVEPTTFIRCFILPRACRGRSSLRHVLPEDAGKTNTQKYHVFGERFVHLG